MVAVSVPLGVSEGDSEEVDVALVLKLSLILPLWEVELLEEDVGDSV